MTIRQTSLVIAVSLSALFVAVVGFDLVEVIVGLAGTRRMASTVTASSLVSRATIELSLERSVMQVALNLNPPITPQFRSIVTEQRRLSDTTFDTAMAVADNDRHLSYDTEFVARLQALRGRIDALRSTADREMALPLAQRDAQLVESLPMDLKATIEAFAHITTTLHERDVALPGLVTVLGEIQRWAWEVREYGGRERTYLAIATADGRPISQRRRGEMAELHARAQFAMEMLLQLSGELPAGDQTYTQTMAVRQVYFERYAQVRTAMFDASDRGESYPLTFDEFFGESSQALHTAVELSVVAGERTLRELAKHQRRAWLHMVVYLMLVVAAVVLCVCQIRYTIRNISSRLNGLADQMGRLAAGDTTIDASRYLAQDEIGRMATALATFRHDAVEKRSLEAQQREDTERTIRQRQREETIHLLAERIERQTRTAIEALADKSDQLHDAASSMRDRLASMVDNASAVADVAASTRESSDRARESVDAFGQALERIDGDLGHSKRAIDGASKTVAQAGQAVSELSARAESVAGVVRSIATVAEQTHMLSLNAAIEAARAGQSGKGFAVVADAVKKLAASTAHFTNKIFHQIAEMQDANGNVENMMEQIMERMQRVDDRSREIFDTIAAQSAGTQEINAMLVENQLQAGHSAEQADELATTAAKLGSLAGDLETLAADLDVQVAQIRNTIAGLNESSQAVDQEVDHLISAG